MSSTGPCAKCWASHAQQAGSLVEAGRLRFDFSHSERGRRATELGEIERLANTRLIENGHVTTRLTTKEEAEKEGALAFFGDKYGDTVRLVKIGQFSVELCGGTHTHTAAQVGPLVVSSESSIGSNIRRVEALTGGSGLRPTSGLEGWPRRSWPAPANLPLRGTRSGQDAARTDRRTRRPTGFFSPAGSRQPRRPISPGEADMVRRLQADRFGTARTQHRTIPAAGNVDSRSNRERGGGRGGSDFGGKGSLVGTVSRDLVGAGVSAAESDRWRGAGDGGGGSRDPEPCPRRAVLMAASSLVRSETVQEEAAAALAARSSSSN